MKMSQFANFTNEATKEVLGEVSLRRENLEDMFSSSIKEGFIPTDYKRMEYLDMLGIDTRIDTGVAGDDETLVFDFDFATLERYSYGGVFGNRGLESATCWRLLNPSGTGDTRNYIITVMNRRASASTPISVVPPNETITGKRINFNLSYGKSVTKYGHYSITVTPTTEPNVPISNANICIGAVSIYATGESTFKGRFWKFKIYSHGELIRNYVPVIRVTDNKAGFFDVVNQTFNPSIGSKDFIAG